MKRINFVLIGLFLGCAYCNISPGLIKDAGSDPKPIASSDGAKGLKAEPAGSTKAAKLCARPDYQCVNYPVTISLIQEDGSAYHKKLSPPTPIIQGKYIHIYAGQTLYVEANVSGNKLTNLRLVQTIIHPDKTIIMRLTQQTHVPPPNNKGMMFVVHNPFDKSLKYHAVIAALAEPSDSGTKTNTCPVKAKKTAAEVWQYPFVQLVLQGFKLIPPAMKEICAD
jgi:hypothetical protein